MVPYTEAEVEDGPHHAKRDHVLSGSERDTGDRHQSLVPNGDNFRDHGHAGGPTPETREALHDVNGDERRRREERRA